MTAPGGFSWTKALDALGRGVHDLVAVERVRAVAEALGTPQPPLHPLERLEAKRLREEARRLDKAATKIEQRGPTDDDA
jgi:hypothetical protein